MSIKSDQIIDASSIRLGPFPTQTKSLSVTVNGKATAVSAKTIGDSKWGWLKIGGSTNCRIVAHAK